MPFKSEKQRRYLWANEPEIARDWTDTYGSKIHKADGGRIGFYRGKGTSSSRSSSKDTSNDYGQFSRAVSRAANNPTRSSVPDRGGDHGQFQRAIDHAAANKQMAEREARDSISNRAKQQSLNANRRLAYQQMGLIPKQGFNLGITGAILNSITGKMPTNLSNLTDDEAEALALEVNRMKASGQNVSVDMDLFDRVKEGQSLLDQDNLSQQRYTELFPGPTMGTGGGEGGGLPYIWPYEMASAPIEEEEIIETDPINRYAGSYRVRPEYLIAEGGRVPAAYGGIMDSYTGRRAYGLGSVFKKITSIPKKAAKVVKKLVSSDVGKLALGYLATAGLAGYGAGNMQGFYKPGNFMGNIGKSWTRFAPKMLQKEAIVDAGDSMTDWKKKVVEDNLLSKGLGWIKENPTAAILGGSLGAGLYTAKQPVEELDSVQTDYDNELARWEEIFRPYKGKYRVKNEYLVAEGGRIGKQEGGLMDLGGMEKDYRNDGGFVPIGGQEKADDVPARLSRNEFVFTADAVRNAGGGDIDKGAQVMENVMKNLEAGGKVSEESQGQGAQEMFEVSERLSEVV